MSTFVCMIVKSDRSHGLRGPNPPKVKICACWAFTLILLVVQYTITDRIFYCDNKNMRQGSDQRISKRKYSRISLQKRVKLVRLVTECAQTVTKAAKKLSIKLCTARIILKKYKETGLFPMKRNKLRPTPRQESNQQSSEPSSPLPEPKLEEGYSPPKDISFLGSYSAVKQEPVFYPFWVSCQAYYAFLAGQAIQQKF